MSNEFAKDDYSDQWTAQKRYKRIVEERVVKFR